MAAIATRIHENNESNDKLYRKVAFRMYTEMANFRPFFSFSFNHFLQSVFSQSVGIHVLISVLKVDSDAACFNFSGNLFQIFGPKYLRDSVP